MSNFCSSSAYNIFTWTAWTAAGVGAGAGAGAASCEERQLPETLRMSLRIGVLPACTGKVLRVDSWHCAVGAAALLLLIRSVISRLTRVRVCVCVCVCMRARMCVHIYNLSHCAVAAGALMWEAAVDAGACVADSRHLLLRQDASDFLYVCLVLNICVCTHKLTHTHTIYIIHIYVRVCVFVYVYMYVCV
jgi:hypothetical protein